MPNPPFVENLETNLKMLHSKMNIDERYRVPSDQFQAETLRDPVIAGERMMKMN